MEKQLQDMSAAEIRAEISEYEQSQRGPAPSAPDAPGITPEMSDKARDTANALYAESILAKPTGSWSSSEKEFLRKSTQHALKELGY